MRARHLGTEPAQTTSAEHQHIRRALQETAEAVAAGASEHFLHQLVRSSALVLEMDFCVVGILDEKGSTITTVAVWADGEIRENFAYALDGTPCRDVVTTGECMVAAKVLEHYPDEELFITHRIESYAGVRLSAGDDGRPMGIMAVFARQPLRNTDRTLTLLRIFAARAAHEVERERQAASLRASEARLGLFIAHAPAAIAMFDAEMRYLAASRRWRDDYRLADEDPVGRSYYDIMPHAPEGWRAVHSLCLSEALERSDEARVERPDGRVQWYRWAVRPWRRENGDMGGLLMLHEDITERRADEERIRHLAFHDTLTLLPNRALFLDRLEQALHQGRRTTDPLAVLFIDLDRFKAINDSLGHVAGDELLRQVANRLKELIREEDTVARLGGDEFVILLPRIAAAQDAAYIATRTLHALAAPYSALGHELHVTTSVGISLFPRDGEDADSLLKHADAALYQAKDYGRNCYQFFDRRINAKAKERLAIENDLRHALDRGELTLHYQPQCDLRRNNVVAVEALLRWHHPKLGVVAPDRFIPIAEETGLIEPIGRWVLETACRQGVIWNNSGYAALRVAVNISVRQLRNAGFAVEVAAVLRETGFNPRLLELEITESGVMADAKLSIHVLNKLHRMGVNLSVDDFGTGYSSLAYLKQLPLHRIKIDQSFVRDVPTDPDDMAIVQAILALAHQLRIRVVAEGVETQQQFRFLQEHGCDEAQGYRICKPLPVDAMTIFLADESTSDIAAMLAMNDLPEV